MQILSESRIDFKYLNIYSRTKTELDTIEGTFSHLLKILIRQPSTYHIRYIKYRGKVTTILRLLVIYLTALFSGSKIVWTCHNIYEHNIPSKRYNDVLRRILCSMADSIVVLHKDLLEKLPKSCLHKTHVASFGEFKSYIEEQAKNNEQNTEFQSAYSDWRLANNLSNGFIISVSAAKKNNLELLIDANQNSGYPLLLIAPHRKSRRENDLTKNILYYNNGFVKQEINGLLQNEGLIGFIGHDNFSVPTSVYMYASYTVPMIGLDHKPVSTLITEYKIGRIWDGTPATLPEIIADIQANYQSYTQRCKRFLEINSWENSAKVHDEIFRG